MAACAVTACSGTNRGLTLPKQAGPVPVSAPRQPTAAEQAYWDQLAPARVIYIGETHNSNSDHEYQWDVLKGLKARGTHLPWRGKCSISPSRNCSTSGPHGN